MAEPAAAAAPAAEPASWAELQAIEADAAKTVKPADIPNPVNADLLSSPPDAFPGTPWDGSTATYALWISTLKQAINTHNLGWVTPGFRGTDPGRLAMHTAILGDPVFIHEHYPPLTKAACRRLDNGRKATADSAQRAVFGFLTTAVDTATRQQLCEDGDDLENDPDKFMAAAAALAQGTTASTSGSQALADFFGLVWPANGTVTEQIHDLFLTLHRARQVTIAVNDPQYEISPAAAIVKITSILPAQLSPHKRTYAAATTLAGLKMEMLRDAEDADRASAAGLRSFAAVDIAAIEARVAARFQAKLDALTAQVGHRPGRTASAPTTNRSDGRVRHSHAVMTDPSAPPPDGRKWNFCVHHGAWSTSHTSEQCYKAHPELAPRRD
jgi:hypothetical protein